MAEAKMEDMLTPEYTTYLNDYRKTVIKAPVKTQYIPKPSCMGIRKELLKDVHTLCDWKTAVPFDLLHQPRPVVQTNPNCVQKPYTKPVDDEREKAQKTRPRLVMTPAVSMDDIDDRRVRSLLASEIYTSALMRSQRESVSAWTSVRAPLPGRPAPANPITLGKLQFPLVSPEWRMETVHWDNRQLRTHCDPTKEFWLKFPLPDCKACDETAVVKADREMRRQQKGK